VLDIVLRYDPVEDRWTSMTSMPTARAYASAASAGGKIYVIGGWDQEDILGNNEVYTPSRDLVDEFPWEIELNFPNPGYTLAVESFAEMIFVIGEERIFQYSIQNKTWNILEEDIQLRSGNFGVSSSEGYFYIFGGEELPGTQITRNFKYQVVFTTLLPQIYSDQN